MSDIKNINETLQKIKAPDLTSSNYGKNIEEQFENIDSNFQKLGNYDFIKGERGSDLGLDKIPLLESAGSDFILTELGAKVINTIFGEELFKEGEVISKSLDEAFNPIKVNNNVVNWYDYFLKDNNINTDTSLVSVFYRDVNPLLQDSIKEYIGSPTPFIFIDARFTSTTISRVKDEYDYSIYSDLKDTSCALYVKYIENEWKVEKINQFPTLTYNNNNFEWKISDENTGIRAQGVPGKDGHTGNVWIGLCEYPENDNIFIDIKSILSKISDHDNHWITPEKAVSDEGLQLFDTIIMIPESVIRDGNNKNVIWFSYVQQKEDGTYVVYYDKDNTLDVSIGNTWMRETMLNIGNSEFDIAKGLFLRLYPSKEFSDRDLDSKKAHILYAYKDSLKKGPLNNLCLRPVENLDNVDSESLTDCNFSIKDYNSVTVKPITVLDLLSKSINLTASSDKVNVKGDATIENNLTFKSTAKKPFNVIDVESNEGTNNKGLLIRNYTKTGASGAAMNFWTEISETTDEASERCNHYVDICGSGSNNNRGSINMWGDGYLDNKGHYRIGPSGSFVSNNNPDVSILKSGQLQANKGLKVKNGASISSGLSVTEGAKISNFVEVSGDYNNSAPYIGFKYNNSTSNTSVIRENTPGRINIQKDFSVSGETNLTDVEIKSPTGYPVISNSRTSGDLVSIIGSNWRNSSSGVKDVFTIPSEIETSHSTNPNGLNMYETLSGYGVTEGSNIIVKSDKMKFILKMNVHIKNDTAGCTVYKVQFNDVRFNLKIRVGSDFHTIKSQYMGTITGDIPNITINQERDAYITWPIDVNEEDLDIKDVTPNQRISVIVEVKCSGFSLKTTGSTKGLKFSNYYTQLTTNSNPRNITVNQAKMDNYVVPKALVSGNTILLGANRHRTFGLYLDTSEDSGDSLLGGACGLFFSYTGKDAKERLVKITAKQIYKAVTGNELSTDSDYGNEIKAYSEVYADKFTNMDLTKPIIGPSGPIINKPITD